MLRSLLVALVILALAEPRRSIGSNRVTTIFVLDRSESIPAAEARRSLDFVSQAVSRSGHPNDAAGLVVFGKDARFDLPIAHPAVLGEIHTVRSAIDPSASDLASGVRLAMAALPAEGVGRIVLISDGNETRGDVLSEASAAKQSGIAIDVVPIDYRRHREVIVEKIVAPERLKIGDRASVRVVLRSLQATSGVLRIERLNGATSKEIARQAITLKEGVNVRTLDLLVTQPDLVRLRAEFIPADPEEDFFPENNSAETYAILEGPGRVLVIEDPPGRQATLIEALGGADLVVIAMPPEEVVADLAFLRAFDAILLADVPAARLKDDLQERLATCTTDLGVGFLMVGGPQSFGPGGYEGSPIEEILPVDCQVKSTLVDADLAIVLVIDRSGSMSGQKLAMALQGAKAAVGLLDPRAALGVLRFDSEPAWVRDLVPIADREKVYRRIDAIGVSGGTNMGPALEMALDALRESNAMTRHVIVLSDGVSAPADWDGIIRAFRKAKVTMTTVALGADCDVPLLRRLAIETRGRFHHALQPSAVPKIYLRETRIVSRPLIHERAAPWAVAVADATEPLEGLPSILPPITGLVLTTPKPSADVAVISPQPAEIPVNPLVAHWQSGVGRAVAVTTDAGERWTRSWPLSDTYARLWVQLVRWALRPEESRELSVTMMERGGTVTVVVDAVGAEGDLLNFLDMKGSVHKPDASREDLVFRQGEPGKYVAEFEASGGGSYIVDVAASSTSEAPLRATGGITVAAAPEQRAVVANVSLLESIADRTGGQVASLNSPASLDFFRRDRPGRVRFQDVWPTFLLLGLVLLLVDVAVRRIAIAPADLVSFAASVWQWLRRRPIRLEATASLDRLRARKIAMAAATDRRSSAPPAGTRPAKPVASSASTEHAPTTAATRPADLEAAPSSEESDRMSRLMKAKRKVWEERK